MTPQERAEKHWDGYVGPMQRELLAHMVEVCMAMSRFHYVTSHVHGVKHEQQDARETARAAFTPVHEKIDIADMPNGSVVYSPSIPVQEGGDEWVTKDLCEQCNNPDVVCYQGQLKVNGTCKDFQP